LNAAHPFQFVFFCQYLKEPSWTTSLFTSTTPADRLTTVVANGPLVELTAQLINNLGVARVLDARRPKFAEDLKPVTLNQPAATDSRWSLPGAVAGMGAVLVLAAE
jgi:hypothetical protein